MEDIRNIPQRKLEGKEEAPNEPGMKMKRFDEYDLLTKDGS